MKTLPNTCCSLGSFSYNAVLRLAGVTPDKAQRINLVSGGRRWDGEEFLYRGLRAVLRFLNLRRSPSQKCCWDFEFASSHLTRYAECRKVKVSGGFFALNLGPGTSANQKSRKKFDEKIQALKKTHGGYLLYHFDGHKFHVWWLPISVLSKTAVARASL